MLVVTTTVRVLHGVLSHTTNLGPAVPLDGVLVIGPAGLEEWLIRPASAGDDPDLGPDGGWDRLLPARGEAEAGRPLLLVVGDNYSEGPAAPGKGTPVSELGLDVAYDGPLRDGGQGKDVADRQSGLLTAVNELARIHSFRAQDQFVVLLVVVGVPKLDLGHGCAPAGVVENFLDNASDVPMLLGVVERAELDGPLSRSNVCLEDGALALPLRLQRGHI